MTDKDLENLKWPIALTVVGLGAVLVFGSFGGGGDRAAVAAAEATTETTTTPEPSERLAEESQPSNAMLTVLAQNAVRERLSDPSSAKFRNLTVTQHDGYRVVCGEVNSRNRMGGYNGYTFFISQGVESKTFFAEDLESPSDIQQQFCTSGVRTG